jgi:hypothetical protein
MLNFARVQFVARSVILMGLLIGLLFSGGEGIHLLPFPATDLYPNIGGFLETTGPASYNKNVLRFEKKPENSKSKPQHDGPLGTAETALRQFGDLAMAANGKVRVPGHYPFLRSRSFHTAIHGRAPPVS